MSDYTNIAHPYAKASFEFALGKNQLQEWQSMLSILVTVAEEETIASQISSAEGASAQQTEELVNLIIHICQGLVDDHVINLIRVLAENGRLSVLRDLFELFCELKDEHERVVPVTVTSSEMLTQDQVTSLTAALEKKLERQVEMKQVIDDTLVGGMVIKAGETVIDGSLNTSIDRLAHQLHAR
ncbi:F0F1 ATP synthase subunit delta [Vibrio sp. 10N.261.46.E12]|uniref:F0F1 ATP synthase subunit delta n=1 Tax=unclassified Vibrio TaxID=2614977 RepID=UPI000977156E|nr:MULTISPECIES: F0F1 ATP synthase subunit delta [unclassified Vibrio]OMO32039.1 ATP synthase F1 subunit delta [Vibrio sp. 10N.261.45.E1]PMJ23585.1 ATP synthase F1 subunit delta [Vibrio sp. 10N.286.45.B6]PML84877.1 ATP synthase F1 subunit delta [Vibrio sp. 10N.261.49.E11]PMM65368.1 ATP synthase F1 subunit delta [Vibrio sp. 10N.261.46.F12]PMM90424.1 ATP synthase F1 subunit delta [Vibrio sp. 10N.261.46.E8]